MAFLRSNHDATLLDVFRKWPEIANAWHQYAQQVMRGPSALSEGERELLAAFVSRLNGCEYCEASHKRVAERFGLDSGLIDQLDRDVDGSSLSDKQKPLFRFAKKLTQTPQKIEQRDVDDVLDAGWDESTLFHATHVCCAFNAINRLVEGLGIEADEEMAEIGAKVLHERGYRAVKEVL